MFARVWASTVGWREPAGTRCRSRALRYRGQVGQGGRGSRRGLATTLPRPRDHRALALSHMRASPTDLEAAGADWSTTARCSNTLQAHNRVPCPAPVHPAMCPWCTLHAKIPMTSRYHSDICYGGVFASRHQRGTRQQECRRQQYHDYATCGRTKQPCICEASPCQPATTWTS